jgi:aryl-alcohol dehydrogenase-like predicted oxidoreductase
MQTKQLGSQGIMAPQLGLGCMGMSEFYGATNDAESLQTLHRAVDLGITFWDTADVYGPHTNEILLSKALKGLRHKLHWPQSLV